MLLQVHILEAFIVSGRCSLLFLTWLRLWCCRGWIRHNAFTESGCVLVWHPTVGASDGEAAGGSQLRRPHAHCRMGAGDGEREKCKFRRSGTGPCASTWDQRIAEIADASRVEDGRALHQRESQRSTVDGSGGGNVEDKWLPTAPGLPGASSDPPVTEINTSNASD